MKAQSRSIHHKLSLAVIVVSMSVLFSACSGRTSEPTSTATALNLATLTPAATQTLTTNIQTSTVTPQVSNPDAENPSQQDPGLIILSLTDGLNKHLFAYHPSYLPLTRLTDDAWNFDDPAVSPDGTRIAYCADQSGTWEIYILDLNTGAIDQLTQTNSYNCAPSWSPDGQWLIFERYENAQFNLIIQSTTDPASSSIQLTENAGNNYSPAWSPTGREVAFVTDRDGRAEIWRARLDTPDDRFDVIAQDQDSDFAFPVWSPDASMLAWCKSDITQQVEVLDINQSGSTIQTLGYGSMPVWNPSGTGILAVLDLPTENNLVGYEISTARLFIPPILIDQRISSLDWHASALSENVNNYLATQTLEPPPGLWEVKLTEKNETGRTGIVTLDGVSASNPYLSDAVDESFKAMQNTLSAELGWDYLSTLESALLPLTTPPQAGLSENWLYTGRAIAVSPLPLDSGWMAVSREDYSGRTYWRIWLRCRNQNGTCGQPVHVHSWDFNARYSGDHNSYEEAGKIGAQLEGYWVDFSEFAERYGWERLPANSNWRSYFPGSLINVFVNRETGSWHNALLEIYPPEAVEILMENP